MARADRLGSPSSRSQMQDGWLKGHPIRRARKPHRCDYWMGAASGGRCAHIIQPGESYVQGDPDPDRAGGFGHERFCMAHGSLGDAASSNEAA